MSTRRTTVLVVGGGRATNQNGSMDGTCSGCMSSSGRGAALIDQARLPWIKFTREKSRNMGYEVPDSCYEIRIIPTSLLRDKVGMAPPFVHVPCDPSKNICHVD